MRWLDEAAVRMALLDGVPGAGPVRTLMADAETDEGQPVASGAAPSGGLQ
jgi:hypothetical protein